MAGFRRQREDDFGELGAAPVALVQPAAEFHRTTGATPGVIPAPSPKFIPFQPAPSGGAANANAVMQQAAASAAPVPFLMPPTPSASPDVDPGPTAGDATALAPPPAAASAAQGTTTASGQAGAAPAQVAGLLAKWNALPSQTKAIVLILAVAAVAAAVHYGSKKKGRRR